jgi:hypothetical protein
MIERLVNLVAYFTIKIILVKVGCNNNFAKPSKVNDSELDIILFKQKIILTDILFIAPNRFNSLKSHNT